MPASPIGRIVTSQPNVTTHRHSARTSSQPRESVTIRVPVDHRPARTRHPDPVALDAAVQVAAVLVLLKEGLERVEEGHAALVEQRATR